MQNKAQCLVSIFCRVQIGELSVYKGGGVSPNSAKSLGKQVLWCIVWKMSRFEG